MNVRKVAAATVLAAASSMAVLSLGRASDHLDGPRATADPQSDITDVFAFTSPSDPTHVVLAMTLTPFATDASTFSPQVDYAFRVQRATALSPLTLDPTALDVVCTFGMAPAQTVTCSGPGGLHASATVGDAVGSAAGPMRVFAGLRSDPAFFDRQGALATVASGQASFTGHNAFAGANVLAIVVEMQSSAFIDAGPPPVLAVAAETVRKGY
jgi:hypothetical protein